MFYFPLEFVFRFADIAASYYRYPLLFAAKAN